MNNYPLNQETYYHQYDNSLNLVHKINLKPNAFLNSKNYKLRYTGNYIKDNNNIVFSTYGQDSTNYKNAIYGTLKYTLSGTMSDSNYYTHDDTLDLDVLYPYTFKQNLDFYLLGHTDDLCQMSNFQACILKIKKSGGVTAIPFSNTTEGQILAYPNPSKNQFTVDFTSKGSKSIQLNIYNVTGKIIFSRSMKHHERSILQVDQNSLPAGYYNVVINSGDEAWCQKIVITK